MLKIRLQRVGRKHEPVFRLVLTDSKNSPKSGRFNEILGSYDPRNKDQAHFEAEKIKEWISKGAKPSDTVHNLLIDKKIIEGKKINVLPKKTPIVKEKAEEAKPVETVEAKGEAPVETAPEAVVAEEATESPVEVEIKEETPAEVATPEEAP